LENDITTIFSNMKRVFYQQISKVWIIFGQSSSTALKLLEWFED